MTCHVCGAQMRRIFTDLPFKTGHNSIVILKDLPVMQCPNCREFLLDDPTMEQIDLTAAEPYPLPVKTVASWKVDELHLQ